MRYIIEAQDVVRRFGSKETAVFAVNGVSLAVQEKELVVLMGPSGSGKTTLLAILGCLLKPTSGTVRVLERDISTLSARAMARLRGESVGFVFQGFNLLSGLKVWENVALSADFISGHSYNVRSRAMEMLDAVGMGHRIQYFPADLSAGEKQRVAFARAMMNRPKIILADEPTANLDAENRDTVTGLLRKIVDKQNVSAILATHDERIRPLSDRCLQIEDGRLVPSCTFGDP
jgi:putative ABC transport system ATP-binding protein